MRGRLLPGAVLALTSLALCAPAAIAGPGDLTHRQSRLGDAGMTGARGVVVAPDGNHVYVASPSAGAVAIYARGGDGTLTPLGCVEDPGAPASCSVSAEGLSAPQYVAISPDGKNVYAAGGGADSAVVALVRDPATGLLSPGGCWRDAQSSADCSGNNAPALGGAEGVTVSSDGKQVYVGAQSDSSVSTFNRNASTGELTYVSCIGDGSIASGCPSSSPNQKLLYPRELTSSPDGLGVYAAAANSGVAGFLRDPADGALSYAQTTSELAPSLVVGVAVSPDNGSVYTGTVNSSAIFAFTRSPATAQLTGIGCVNGTLAGVPVSCGAEATGLYGAEGVVVPPDGESLYASAFYGSALHSFARSLTTGLLTPAGCVRDLMLVLSGCATSQDGLRGSRAVTISPDGRNVYATGQTDNAIVVFERELPPPRTSGPPPAGPPAAPAPAPAPAPPAAKPKTLRLEAVATLPSTKRCVSRRKFRIRLRHPSGTRIKSATVKLGGRTVATRRGSRVTAPVDLRGLPKGTVKLSLTITLADGRKVSGTRRYRTCAAKRVKR